MNNFDLEAKKLAYIYNNLSNALVALFMVSSLLFYAYYNLVDNGTLSIWYGLNIVLIVLRMKLFFEYKKVGITEENFARFYWGAFVLMALGALLWGAGAFLIFPPDIEYQMIIIILLAGLISGAMISAASKIEMFFLYALLSMSPFCYVLFLQETSASEILAFSIILYILTLLILSRKISDAIVKNLVLVEELEKKVIEANSATKAKSDFLSVMSHEIRTPLNAIIGFVEILLKGEDDAKKKKYLETINRSSQMLTNVINDILHISKIESGNLVLEPVAFDTKEEFATLYMLFKQSAESKNVEFINSIESTMPACLVADILRLKQVLSNLLSNAIKFTEAGKAVELTIRFDTNKESLYCEVRDEGIGIAKEDITQITEAFIQADSSIERKYGGTGLGLSIVTELLRVFGSALQIESELGKGSRFSFFLKVDVCQRELEAEEKRSGVSIAGKRVLVAEDNKTNQMLITILLEELELDVCVADDGAIAEELYKKEHFDIVLMDINMPNKNGTDAMLAIREYEEDLHTPIVALTANAVSGDREKYLEQGFDAYLAKPIDSDALKDILEHYLGECETT